MLVRYHFGTGSVYPKHSPAEPPGPLRGRVLDARADIVHVQISWDRNRIPVEDVMLRI